MNTLAFFAALFAADAEPAEARTAIVVVGASGTSEYGDLFRKWAGHWEDAGRKSETSVVTIGIDETDKPDRERLEDAVKQAAASENDEVWLVLIGHGSFDGRAAKFNLRGRDVTATELNTWLEPCESPVAIVNCASSSAPFINMLSGEGRVIVTATKAGSEMNFARFGEHLSRVIGDPVADLDKDGQTSLLEAWLIASRRTQEFYETEGRLATEHALLDDNGDKRGTRAESFRGIRPIRQTKGEALDGFRAHQFHLIRSDREKNMPRELREQRDSLELAVADLRDRKSEFTDDAYFEELERLLLKLAKVYEQTDAIE